MFPVFKHISATPPQTTERDLLGLKQYLQIRPEYSLQLKTAPTGSPALFKRHVNTRMRVAIVLNPRP